MMPQFSAQSIERLNTCHSLLQAIFYRVVAGFDCTILEGHRSLTRQAELYAEGKSKITRSKHNEDPSIAVDVAPWPIDWNDLRRFYLFAGFVLGVAHQMNIEIRWGGDWNQDTQIKDNTFNDLVHFELKSDRRVV